MFSCGSLLTGFTPGTVKSLGSINTFYSLVSSDPGVLPRKLWQTRPISAVVTEDDEYQGQSIFLSPAATPMTCCRHTLVHVFGETLPTWLTIESPQSDIL